jgi:hypothetical protein
MDLSIQTFPGAPTADYSWLAGDSAAFENAQSGTIDVSTLVSGTHYDATTKVIPSGLALAKVGDYFVPFVAADEVQTATITGTPTGGTFTLKVDGETTAAIAFDANAAAVQAALEALSNVNPGDVTVTGTNPAFTITFTGALGGVNQPTIVAAASLTGGTSPGVTIATSTAGGSSTAGANVLARFVAHPLALLRENGSLSTSVVFAGIVDATIIPSKLPVTSQRSIDENTPTTGKFGYIK